MAIRSNIIIEYKGSYKAIPFYDKSKKFIKPHNTNYMSVYCNYDGYVSDVGKHLYNHYKTKQKVLDLISGGNMSSIGDSLTDCEYYSDCGYNFEWEYNKPISFQSLEKYMSDNIWISYIYVFGADNVWRLYTTNSVGGGKWIVRNGRRIYKPAFQKLVFIDTLENIFNNCPNDMDIDDYVYSLMEEKENEV
jgi:hypothetical protein